MFGDPLRPLAVMSASKRSVSPDTRKLMEEVQEYLLRNLRNIQNTWGVGSEQYESAAAILDSLEKNLKKPDVKRSDINELMQKLSLGDSNSVADSTKSTS
jgi:hypothetical protein